MTNNPEATLRDLKKAFEKLDFDHKELRNECFIKYRFIPYNISRQISVYGINSSQKRPCSRK